MIWRKKTHFERKSREIFSERTGKSSADPAFRRDPPPRCHAYQPGVRRVVAPDAGKAVALEKDSFVFDSSVERGQLFLAEL